MGAQPYSLELPESRRSWLIPMAGLALAIVAAGAVAGINTLRKDGIEAVRPAAEFSAYQGAVTGTGPALIEMAREARSGFTGGLVTGTGPGLIEIAGDQFAEYRGSPVTGTGPALGSMAR
jgi:hypothetical protein